MSKKRNIVREAFKVFSDKGSVNIPTSQQAATQAYKVFNGLLTDRERGDLQTAVGHSLIGEGRGEFDAVCQRIRLRLWK